MGAEIGIADKKWGSNTACGPHTQKSGGLTDPPEPHGSAAPERHVWIYVSPSDVPVLES